MTLTIETDVFKSPNFKHVIFSIIYDVSFPVFAGLTFFELNKILKNNH